MPSRDRLLAVLVAVIWGINFPATFLALQHFPPFLAVALRYLLLAIPAVIFIPRPKVRWRWLLAVGAGLGLVQFGFLYLAISIGMPSGLASIVLQASAPFTVILASVLLRERLSRKQIIGVCIAVAGLAVIGIERAQAAALLPIVLTLIGGLGWALGNISSRKAKAPNPLHLTLWMSIVPPIPMLALSFALEGPARIGGSLGTVFTPAALLPDLGLLYVVVAAGLVGYGIWNTLLARHPSSTVAPFSMLVPVIGVLSSWAAFGELPDPIELIGGALVVGGVLAASIALPRWRRREIAVPAPGE